MRKATRTVRLEPDDARYPRLLRERPRPPALYVRGTLPARPALAIVGTRRPTNEGYAFARRLARELGQAGLAVGSGGAEGIDAAAHEGALDAGAPTFAVCGPGLDTAFPRDNAPLFDAIVARGGALVSLVPDPTPVARHQFLARNRVLAAMCIAIVVVECPLASGARHACASGRAIGRPVAAVPHAPWSERGAGCLEELARGAALVTSARDVLRWLAIPAPPELGETLALFSPIGKVGKNRADPSIEMASSREFNRPFDEEPNELDRAIITAIGAGASHLDAVCDRLERGAGEVAPALLGLVLRGRVVDGLCGLALASRPGRDESSRIP
jgi:DNA processing protein